MTMQQAPVRMLMIRVNSLSKYDGSVSPYDGQFEVRNFADHNGQYYGAIPKKHRIDLTRLGGGRADKCVNGVTIIWIATEMIVGWYRNAILYADVQAHPLDSQIDYRAVCSVKEGRELRPRERRFNIYAHGAPQNTSGRWYLDDPIRDRSLIDSILHYIEPPRREDRIGAGR